MKTILTIITTILLSLCTNAQESKYFNISNNQSRIVCSPKNMKEPSVNKNKGTAQDTEFLYNEQFFEIAGKIFKQYFDVEKIDPNQFSKVHFLFYFDKNLHTTYYVFTFPANQSDKFSELEENLYQFVQAVLKMDISPFVKITNEKTFDGGLFQLNLSFLAKSVKDTQIIHRYF